MTYYYYIIMWHCEIKILCDYVEKVMVVAAVYVDCKRAKYIMLARPTMFIFSSRISHRFVSFIMSDTVSLHSTRITLQPTDILLKFVTNRIVLIHFVYTQRCVYAYCILYIHRYMRIDFTNTRCLYIYIYFFYVFLSANTDIVDRRGTRKVSRLFMLRTHA